MVAETSGLSVTAKTRPDSIPGELLAPRSLHLSVGSSRLDPPRTSMSPSRALGPIKFAEAVSEIDDRYDADGNDVDVDEQEDDAAEAEEDDD